MSSADIVIDEAHLILLRKWISYCIHRHEKCRKRELTTVFPDSVDILLIDVKRMCLVKGSTSHGYLALSYVWGQVPQFSTTAIRLKKLLEPNSLEDIRADIANVIQDAIQLTKSLGEHYLWVDSLCIVQDDLEAKHEQLTLMAEIYNSATVTIIACVGHDASARLCSSSVVHELSKWQLDRVDRQCRYYPAGTSQRRYTLEPGIRRPLSTKRLTRRIARSRHSQRGWTYQERLLSRRRLYFVEGQVVFNCREDFYSENGEIEVKTEIPFEMNYYTTIQRQKLHGSEWPSGLGSSTWNMGFHFWSNTVREYSGRQFTFSTDVLDACTGILHAFQGYTSWSVLEGMPEPVLDLALLWVPSTIVKRRFNRSNHAKHIQFPSWSWIGWEGEVTFDLTGEENYLGMLESRISSVAKSSQHGIFPSGMVQNREGWTVHSRISNKHPVQLEELLEMVNGNPDLDEADLPPSLNFVQSTEDKEVGDDIKDHQEGNQRSGLGDEGRSAHQLLKPDPLISSLPRTLLRFLAFATPGTTFLSTHLSSPASKSTSTSPGLLIQPCLWLSTQEQQLCGILYGISDSLNATLGATIHNLYFVLLSENALAPYPHFPSILEGEDQVPIARSTVPMGTLLNIMLVEQKRDLAERIAIGQIVATASETAGPRLHTIILG